MSKPEANSAAPWNDGLARGIRAGLAAVVAVIVVAMFPLSPQPAIDLKVVLYQIAALVLGGAWLVAVAMGRAPFAWPRAFGPAIALLLAAQAVSLFAADHRADGYLQITQSVCLAVLFLVASQVYRTAADARPLLVAFCLGVGLSTLYAFAQKAGYDPFPWEASQRETSTYLELPGTFGNPNVAGHGLILALIVAAYLAGLRGTRWCAILIPLFAAHLYLTNFRAGLLALGGGVVVAGLAAALARSRLKPVWAARATVAGALAIAVGGAALLVGYVNASSSHRMIDDSILLRFNAYYGAADMITNRPVLGYGLGRYAAESPPFWTDFEQRWLAEKHLMNEHVHSDVLETWVETGIAGAFSYVLLLLAGVYWSARRAAQTANGDRRFALALTAFFAAFAADGLFGFNARVPVTAATLFLVAGIAEGVYRVPSDRFALQRPLRVAAAVLGVVLFASAAIGGRDFLAKVSLQTARNALAFDALAAADQWSAHAVRLAPYAPQMRVTRAETLLKLGWTDSAVVEYQAALRARPYDVPVLLGLARAHLSAAVEWAARGGTAESLGALNDARAVSERAIDLCRYLPDGAELLGRVTLAEAHLREDERVALAKRAEAQFLSALKDGAENVAELFVLAAECRTLIGDDGGAEAYLARAVVQDPAASSGWEAFLDFARRTKRFERLGRAFEQAIPRAEKQGDSEQAGRLIAWRARLYLLQGQPFADGAAEFDRALDASPNTAEIWEDYAAAARLAGEEVRFGASVRNVASNLPNVGAVRTALSGRPSEAAEELHALAVRVSTPGAVDLTVSDLAWALDYVRATILESGADESALIEGLIPIAAAYDVLELPGEAASVYLTLAERSSGTTQATAAIKAGALLVRLSRADEAVAVIKNAMRTNMNNVALRVEYARALKAAGKPSAARLELNLLLRQYRLDAAQQSAVEAELETL